MNIKKYEVIELLKDMVEIPSPYFQEQQVMDYVFSWFNRNNLPINYHHYYDKKVTNIKDINLFGEIKGQGDGLTVLLNGHLDTVNLCSNWSTDPFKAKIDEDKMFGLGVLDMKAGCVAIMLAVKAFYENHKDFKGKIIYSFVSGEEGPYGLGTNFLIEDKIINDADVAIITEPSAGFTSKTFPTLCLGARGGFSYQIKLVGLSAHAANPEQGVSAIEDASRLILELGKTELKEDPELGKGSICFTTLESGGQACSVADEATITIFRHTVPGETKETICKEIEEAVKRAAIGCKYSVKFREDPLTDIDGFKPYKVDPENEYVKAFVNVAKKVTEKDVNLGYFSSIGDFDSIASRLNIPTLVFGPSGSNYHSCDEFVYLPDVVDTAKVLYEYLEYLLT